MRLIYDFAITLLTLGIQMTAWFHPKAKLWVNGRKHWRQHLKEAIALFNETPQQQDHSQQRKKILWLHAASLGEFEQGRPILESFRERYPDWKIVLSFFSPSGFEVRKNYPLADLVCYLPADTCQNARDFLELIRPDLAVFVKYEFWANYLFELQKRGTPTLLVSAIFRPSQPFFKWHGGFWRKMLGCYAHVFVQNEPSGNLLQSIGIQHFSVAGDTRVDRVLKIAEQAPENTIVGAFVADNPRQVIVAGSSWEADEGKLMESLNLMESCSRKIILAPHEPSRERVEQLCKQFRHSIRYSHWFGETATGNEPPTPAYSTLIIDNIGLLNTLYRYGTVAFIGGGFGKGIHNTLEPAAYGLPIIFGSKYEKFEEARQFVVRGGAFSVQNAAQLADVLTKLQDPVFYQHASRAVLDYLEESRGATDMVMEYLERIFARM